MERSINRGPLIFGLLTIFILFPMWHAVADAADEGTLKWIFNTGGETTAPALGHNGTIYVGSENLYAINADGTLEWIYEMQGAGSPAVGCDGTIYLGSGGYLYAISPEGNRKWRFFTRESGHGVPAIGRDGTIYILSFKNECWRENWSLLMYAINPDGTEKWVAPYDQYVDCYREGGYGEYEPPPASSLAIGQDGTIYVNSLGEVLAFSSDGGFKGAFDVQYYDGNIAIGKEGWVYLCRDHGFDVMDPDGTNIWQWWYEGDYYSILVGPDDAAYVKRFNEGYWDFKRVTVDDSGWRIEGNVDPAAIGYDGTFYGMDGAGLFAYDQDGDQKWFFPINGPSSPAIGEDGTLYVGSTQGLVAINSSSNGPANEGWPLDRHDAQRTCRSAQSGSFVGKTANFNCGAGEFDYMDDTFHNTNRPLYANGNYAPTGGYGGSGGLHLVLGGVDNKNILNGMSGGWQATFSIDEAMNGQFELRYRLVMNRYDADECTEVLVSIDGGAPYVLEEQCGRLDTGWKQGSFSHYLSAGSHTITIGGFNNKKTYSGEFANIYIDDVSLSGSITGGPETNCSNGMDDDDDGMTDCEDEDCDGVSSCEYAFEHTCNDSFDNDADGLSDCDDTDCDDSQHCTDGELFSVDFNSGVDGFAYKDDPFYNTNQPVYADGNHTPTGGYGSSGGLHVMVGGVNNKNIYNGMSGGWKGSFSVAETMDVQIELRYRLITKKYDTDECAKVLVSIDDGPAELLEELCGRNKDTGWDKYTITQYLAEGDHTITIGAYNNKKTYYMEFADLYIDDVKIE